VDDAHEVMKLPPIKDAGVIEAVAVGVGVLLDEVIKDAGVIGALAVGVGVLLDEVHTV
jgi:hypothetical protein